MQGRKIGMRRSGDQMLPGMRQKPPLKKRVIRQLRFVLINAVVAFLVAAAVIAVLNSRIVTAVPQASSALLTTALGVSSSQQNLPAQGDATSADGYQRVVLIGVPDDAQFLEVSFDNHYYSYVEQGVLHVFDLSTKKERYSSSRSDRIVYALMLKDSDLLMYFYRSGNAIHMSTYNLTTQRTLPYRSINVASNAAITQVNYAVNTDLVYFVARPPRGGDTLYRVNIMNRVTTHALSVKVAQLIPSATSLGLYYQDTQGVLYYNYAPAPSTQGKKFELIGRDGADNFYLLSKDVPGQVEVLNRAQGKITRTFSIPAGVQRFYQGQSSLYAIYPDRIIDLMSKAHDPVTLGAQGRFVAAVGTYLYFLPAP